MPESDNWYVVVTVGTGVQFRGTHDEVQEHRNKFIEYLKDAMADKKLMCKIQDVKVVKQPTGVTNGGSPL